MNENDSHNVTIICFFLIFLTRNVTNEIPKTVLSQNWKIITKSTNSCCALENLKFSLQLLLKIEITYPAVDDAIDKIL